MALYPTGQSPNDLDLAKLDQGFQTLLPRLGVVQQVMTLLNLKPKKDLLPLLACFAPIDTHGASSLYQQRFLSPSLLKQDNLFADDGYGNFLQKAAVSYSHSQPTLEQPIINAGQGHLVYSHTLKRLSYTGVLTPAIRDALVASSAARTFQDAIVALYTAQRLTSHQAALRAGCSLTDGELSAIVTALRFDANTPLTLNTLTEVFRRGWLARKLKLSVQEFLWLTQYTGFDPFTMPDPPERSLLTLVEWVDRLRATSLKPSEALYLIWNQDISGRSAPDNSEIVDFARTLRSGFAAIDSEYALLDDPTGQISRTQMAQVYNNEATDLFFGLIDNTFATKVDYSRGPVDLTTTVPYSRGPVDLTTVVSYEHHQAALEASIANAGQGLIAYDHNQKQLSCSGTLTTVIRDALKAVPNVTDQFKAAVDLLYDENDKVIKAQLEQPIVQVSQGLIQYNDAQKQLVCVGTLTTAIREALKKLRGVTDEFKIAVDSLYAANYQVVKANLQQAIVEAAPGLIAYDDFRKQLSFTGELTDKICTLLKNAGMPQKVVDELLNVNQGVIEPFFNRYPELKPLYKAYQFFGQLSSSVGYTHPKAALEDAILKIAPDRLTYDPNRKQLSWQGVLSESWRDELKKVPGVSPDFITAINSLCTENQNAIQAFFTKYPSLKAYQAAYLLADNVPEQMRSVLLASFLPHLKERRKHQQALQAISAATKSDVGFANALLDDPTVLHGVEAPDLPALHDLKAIETQGLAVQFFFRNTATGTVDESREAEASLAYGERRKKLPAPAPASAISGIWSGYLEAPENGLYNLRIKADAAATVKVLLEGKALELNQDGRDWSNKTRLELRGGTLYQIALTVENVTQTVEVRWETTGRGREIIPAQYLYSNTLVDRLSQIYVRFLKATSLASALKLTPAEMAYLVCASNDEVVKSVTYHHPQAALEQALVNVAPGQIAYDNDHKQLSFTGLLTPTIQDALKVASGVALARQKTIDAFNHAVDRLSVLSQGWLNHLPVSDQPNLATSAALVQALSSLINFARMKADLAPKDERLLMVLKDPAVKTQRQESLLLSLTRWEAASLDALLTRFGKTINGVADRTALMDVDTLARVYDAYAWVKKLRIPADALIEVATNEPNADTVRNLQAALRARYDESDWLTVIKPINDEMRGLQRDALVAYILHQMRQQKSSEHIDTPDKLFEYFLMDVQMEPCMQTSRIRHALSSVQLFIERCLMNLEPRVNPSVIDAKQWEWMKRYRVWEANRKVFLYPENWLEPELRDDQSPGFKATMSELLQSDISEERAKATLNNYLTKLEEMAKLEPCGVFYDQYEPDTMEDDVAHVVARTAGANRKYYYRRCEGGVWTSWEQIPLDIEDNPVVPVVWQGRLLLFWLKILQKPIDLDKYKPIPDLTVNGKASSPPRSLASMSMSEIKDNTQKDAKANTKLTVQTILCFSEFYNGKWQPTKTSDVNDPNPIGTYPVSGADAFNRSALRLSISAESGKLKGAERLNIHIENTQSLTDGQERQKSTFQLYNTHSRPVNNSRLECIKGFVNISQQQILKVEFNYSNQHSVLIDNTDDPDPRVIQPLHLVKDSWKAPFFYEGRQHVFYVTRSGSAPSNDSDGSYGHQPILPGKQYEIPPIRYDQGGVIRQIQPIRDRLDNLSNKVLETQITVRFGNKELGPKGSFDSSL
jgi:hypothetical protein